MTITVGSVIEVEEITGLEEYRVLAAEWMDLFNRCPYATPFQSPAWLIPWWEHFATGNLWTLALRAEGRLIGLAALYRHPGMDGRTRQITFIGTGNSDYLDILVDPEHSPEGANAVLKNLSRNRTLWDECDFLDLKGESPLLSATVPPEIDVQRAPLSVCPVVNLPDSFEDYLRSLPSVHRRKAKKETRVLESMGDLRLETATKDTLEEYLIDFFRLHRAEWKERGLPGALSDESIQDFHRSAASGFLKAGWLRLYRLALDGKAIAYVYGIAQRGRFYSYLGAFEPDMRRYSPGVVILMKIMEECIRNGLRVFDFLRGREAYKYLWGAVDTETYRYRIRHG